MSQQVTKLWRKLKWLFFWDTVYRPNISVMGQDRTKVTVHRDAITVGGCICAYD